MMPLMATCLFGCYINKRDLEVLARRRLDLSCVHMVSNAGDDEVVAHVAYQNIVRFGITGGDVYGIHRA